MYEIEGHKLSSTHGNYNLTTVFEVKSLLGELYGTSLRELDEIYIENVRVMLISA